MDARSAPKRVLAAHLPNQLTDFLRHRWAAALAAANLPSPKQSKSLAVPSDDGSRFDDAKSRTPVGPGSTKPSPQEPVESIQFRLLHRTLQHAKLVAESQDLKLQCRSSAEDRQCGRKQCRYHGGRRELTENAQLPLYQADLNLREPQFRPR